MSKTRAFQLGAAAVASVAVLSACSSETAGNPSTATPRSAGSSSAAASTSQLAPKVPSALPTDALTTNPCSALSPAQVTKIGLTGAGEMRQDDLGPNCKWRSATSQFNVVYLSPMTINKNGLSDIYAAKANFAYFEPTTVNGYPGVYASPTENRSGGDCQLWVGVTEQLSVSVSDQIGDGPNKTNPCLVTERVATAMINHLQGKE